MGHRTNLLALGMVMLLAGSFFAASAVGAPDEWEPPIIDASTRASIVEWVAEVLSSRYVNPENAEAMIERMRSRAKDGAYATLDDPGDFLHALERDLYSVSNDKHIGLWTERPGQATDEDVDYTPADPLYVESLRRTNYGYKKIEILPGNIGYLRIDEFAHSALGGPTTVAVMNTLANVDALIIDLRWNGGGAGMTPLVSAYFFDQPTHLNDMWVRASDETVQTWTPEYAPGPSLSAIPLYILISGQTFSAAEGFTYALKHLGRATVVGARSKGGGHPVEFVRLLRDDMVVAMMVPYAKSVNQVTGTSWEGVGVEPDLKAPAPAALETAYLAAIDQLLGKIKGEQERLRIEWSRTQFLADRHAVRPTPELLAEYAGTFGKRRFLVGADGVLIYRRDAGSDYELVPMGNDMFRFEGYDALRFQFGRDSEGRVDRVFSLRPDGTRETERRTE